MERDPYATRKLEAAEVLSYLAWREQQQQQQQGQPPTGLVLDPMRRLTIGAFDMGIATIARELHGVVHGSPHKPGPRYLILSEDDTLQAQASGGQHWISVAYELVPDA